MALILMGKALDIWYEIRQRVAKTAVIVESCLSRSWERVVSVLGS